MAYSKIEMVQLKERLDIYEKALASMLVKFNRLEKRKVKGKSKLEDDCIIHLSFSGLNRAMSIKDSKDEFV
ncbi:MAG: hypothetical protein RBT33_02420 [Candidatus Dojkabacteria bacterium]|jgi:hypothetical protein|nr:hypothetical protein [Candidatus Dojkabacteria bacterium]